MLLFALSSLALPYWERWNGKESFCCPVFAVSFTQSSLWCCIILEDRDVFVPGAPMQCCLAKLALSELCHFMWWPGAHTSPMGSMQDLPVAFLLPSRTAHSLNTAAMSSHATNGSCPLLREKLFSSLTDALIKATPWGGRAGRGILSRQCKKWAASECQSALPPPTAPRMGNSVKEGQTCLQLHGRENPVTRLCKSTVVVYLEFLCGFLTLSKPGVPSLWMQICASHQHYTCMQWSWPAAISHFFCSSFAWRNRCPDLIQTSLG